jgi:hypothetical protein
LKKQYLLIGLSFIALASCGQDVATALDRNIYHTQLFSDNMYVDEVLGTSLASQHIASVETHVVDSEDLVTGVANLKTADRFYDNNGMPTVVNDDIYSTTNKLSLTLPEVKYGFESKLYDGILHCSDAVRISKSRLQLQASGYGYVFPKALVSVDHVGLYLKAGADTYLGGIKITDVRVNLSFYIPTAENQYAQHVFQFDVFGLRGTDFPQFYGFYFSDVTTINLSGANAYSVTYQILDAAAASSDPDLTALFVYEMLLPKSVWQ